MNFDPTEQARRDMLASGEVAQDAAMAEASGEQTWTTAQLQNDFEVLGFMAPFVVVRRFSDGQKGSMEFANRPERVYFNFLASS